jgi:hypothetical protein
MLEIGKQMQEVRELVTRERPNIKIDGNLSGIYRGNNSFAFFTKLGKRSERDLFQS